MLIVGFTMMIGTLAIFKFYKPEINLGYGEKMVVFDLIIFQKFNVLNWPSESKSLFKIGFFTNPKLLGAILISVLMQILVIHTPLNTFFKTIPLTMMDWVYVVLVSSTVLIIVEIHKFVASKLKQELTA